MFNWGEGRKRVNPPGTEKSERRTRGILKSVLSFDEKKDRIVFGKREIPKREKNPRNLIDFRENGGEGFRKGTLSAWKATRIIKGGGSREERHSKKERDKGGGKGSRTIWAENETLERRFARKGDPWYREKGEI